MCGVDLPPARVLARAIEAKKTREQKARSGFVAKWGPGSAGGADALRGVQMKDLGRDPTVLEEEIYKHMAEVAADPTVFTAYMPPVARSHPSVHPAYARKQAKRSAPVSWMYAMSVSPLCPPLFCELSCVVPHVSTADCVSHRTPRGLKWAKAADARFECVHAWVQLSWFDLTPPLPSFRDPILKSLPFAPCHAFFLLPQLNLDNTWGTTKEGFELCTVMGSLGGILGASIASIYVGDKSSATIQRALQWVTDLMARHGILLHPEVVIADDDKGERKAVKLTWPKCQLR